MVTCALCGRGYEPGGESCRARQCPLAFTECRIAHCPHCGYTSADDTRGVAGWLRRFLGGAAATTEVGLSRLTDVAAGTLSLLERIDGAPDVAASLGLLGLTPGCRVTLHQRFPAFVLGLEGNEVALERSVAEQIWVRRLAMEGER